MIRLADLREPGFSERRNAERKALLDGIARQLDVDVERARRARREARVLVAFRGVSAAYAGRGGR